MQYSCSDANDLLTIFGIRTTVLDDSVVSLEGCAQDLQMIVFGCRILKFGSFGVRQRVRGDWLGPPVVPILSCTTIGPGEGPERQG